MDTVQVKRLYQNHTDPKDRTGTTGRHYMLRSTRSHDRGKQTGDRPPSPWRRAHTAVAVVDIAAGTCWRRRRQRQPMRTTHRTVCHGGKKLFPKTLRPDRHSNNVQAIATTISPPFPRSSQRPADNL